VIAALFGASVGGVVEHLHHEQSEAQGWRSDLSLSVTGLSADANAASIVRSRGLDEVLSENDRAMMANYVVPFDLSRAPHDAPAPLIHSDTLGERLRREGVGWDTVAVATRSSLHGRTWAWLLLLTVPLISLRQGRQAFALSSTLALAICLLALTIAVLSRLPDRVALPMVLVGVIAVAVAGLSAGPPRSSDVSSDVDIITRSVWARIEPEIGVLVSIVLLITGAGTESAIVRVHQAEAETSTVRIVQVLDDLERLADREEHDGTEPIFALWLFPTYLWAHPLEWNAADRYQVTTVEVAGWGNAMPYRTQRLTELGMNDWLGAVADRDEVWLVANPARTDFLAPYFRERRGWLCPDVIYEPGGVVGDRYWVVKRVVDAPCQGTRIELWPLTN
jgi:hypothetical protein